MSADTNVLLRALVGDDAEQGTRARQALRTAETVAVSTTAVCELVWVLSRGYHRSPADIAEAIQRLVGSANVVSDRAAIEAGLAFLRAGAEFADGVIAHEGRRLGAAVFLSFDHRAVSAAHANGYTAAAPLGGSPG